MGRTVLHMEPVMQGGPKRPAGTSQLRCKTRGLHSIGGTGRRGYDCSAPQNKSCDLHPGKTAAETGRAKRAALIGDNQRKPKETTSARIARPGSCFCAAKADKSNRIAGRVRVSGPDLHPQLAASEPKVHE